MTALRLCKILGLNLSAAQRRAFWYLELQGMRFCVEFGTENAVWKAAQHRREKRWSKRR